MAECERFRTCPFFNDQLAYMPRTAYAMKQKYCYGDKKQCARYLVAIQGIKAPGDLFPDEVDRAHKILSNEGKRDAEPRGSNPAAPTLVDP